MAMKRLLFLLPLLTALLFSCKQDEYVPKISTSGGNTNPRASSAVTLVPTSWLFFVGDAGNQRNPNNYQKTIITSESSATSPISGTGLIGVGSRPVSYTLGITAPVVNDTASYSYWAYAITPPTALRVGKSLTLKARIRLDQVQGKGVSLALRGDRTGQSAMLFATTEGKSTLTGTADFAPYSVTLPYTAAVESIILYCTVLPRTTGKVLFTDVSLQIN